MSASGPVLSRTEAILLLLVILGTISFLWLTFRKFKRREKEGIEKALNPVIPTSPEYTFEEQSKLADLIFRCPNPSCRAYFVEPRIVVSHMVKERELPKKYCTCPKCGAILEPKKKEEVKANG